jgi:hypothetical protein
MNSVGRSRDMMDVRPSLTITPLPTALCGGEEGGEKRNLCIGEDIVEDPASGSV